MWGLTAQIRELRAALELYNKAADRFIDKVDRGEARSVATYAELKSCRAQAQNVLDKR